MTQPLAVVPAASASSPTVVPIPGSPTLIVAGRHTVRAGGSAITIVCDATGAAIAAEMPVSAYLRMSSVMRREIDGRPHILTWCTRYGRVEIPAILLDLPASAAPSPMPEDAGAPLRLAA